MMTSQHGARILRFPEIRILHLKVLFTFDFYFSITIRTRDTSLDPFSSQFCVDDVTTLSQNFKILRERFHKVIINLKVLFTFDSYLPINIEIPNQTFFSHFWVDDVTAGTQNFQKGQKSQNFEIVNSKSNGSPHISLYY